MHAHRMVLLLRRATGPTHHAIPTLYGNVTVALRKPNAIFCPHGSDCFQVLNNSLNHLCHSVFPKNFWTPTHLFGGLQSNFCLGQNTNDVTQQCHLEKLNSHFVEAFVLLTSTDTPQESSSVAVTVVDLMLSLRLDCWSDVVFPILSVTSGG